jgi:hypothetical protein
LALSGCQGRASTTNDRRRVADASIQSAIYGGEPFYSGGTPVMDALRSSGFTTIIVWSIHVDASGDLVLNNRRLVSNGTYVGDPAWPGVLATLKQAPTSVSRVELSVGSAGVDDWHHIQSLIASSGIGPQSILYRNFQALLDATGADAINDDDEDLDDVSTTVQFGQMVASLQARFTIAPYANTGFWQTVVSSLRGIVDRAYLQVYDGGAGNDPADWSRQLGITVDPGLWSKHGNGCVDGDSPASMQSRFASWRSSAGIGGGFVWLADDVIACSRDGAFADYASAIDSATGGCNQGQCSGAGLDLDAYCRNMNPSSFAVLLDPHDAYTWRCQVGASQVGMDLNRACSEQYGASWYAVLGNRSDPDSWRCVVAAAAPGTRR